MFSKHLGVLLLSRHDTSSEGFCETLLRPLRLARPFYRGRLPFLRSYEGASTPFIFLCSPFVDLGFVYPPFLLLMLLQKGSREGRSLPHCPAIHHHGLVVSRVHPLCWWTRVYVLVLGRNRRGYVDIWLPSDLFSAGVDSALDSRDL